MMKRLYPFIVSVFCKVQGLAKLVGTLLPIADFDTSTVLVNLQANCDAITTVAGNYTDLLFCSGFKRKTTRCLVQNDCSVYFG